MAAGIPQQSLAAPTNLSRAKRELLRKDTRVKPHQYLPQDVLTVEFHCRHLSFAQRGAYEALRHLQWMTPGCSIPEDNDWIMRKLAITPEEYGTYVIPVLEEFFVMNKQNRLHDPYVTERFAWVTDKSKKGKVGANARWDKEKPLCDRNASGNGKEKKRKERKDKKDTIDPKEGSIGAGAPDPRKMIYDLGKQLLGKSAGGQITRICKQEGGDMGRALSVLLKAQLAASPAEYIGAYLKNGKEGEDGLDRAFRKIRGEVRDGSGGGECEPAVEILPAETVGGPGDLRPDDHLSVHALFPRDPPEGD